MPYRRRYARRRTSTRRRPARRYTRRPTRVTRYRRRPTMSRRRILNITTKKKQDTMVPVVPADLIATSVVAKAVTITGAAPQVMVWVATARDRASPSEDQESESRRTSQTVYMRGLKERVTILTNNSVPWKWRRICFTAKGLESLEEDAVFSVETSSSWARLLNLVGSSSAWFDLSRLMFKGTAGTDYLNAIDAKVDTQRVTLKYDKTITIHSGNDTGKFMDFKHWHPMNANLVYADRELAETDVSGERSATGRAGMGDYYVVDLFACGSENTANTMTFAPTATLYWHEK